MRGSRKSFLAWSLLALLAVSLVSVPAFAQEDEDDSVADVVAEAEDEYEDVLSAHLIVYKSRVYLGDEDTSRVIVGRNVTIKIDIYNSGSGPAKSVQLHDSLPPDAMIIEGSLDANLGTVASDSSATHTYVIQFTKGGLGMLLPAAQVAYQADDATVVMGLSSSYVIYVLTPTQQIIRWLLVAGSYSTLGLAHTPEHWRNILIFVVVVGGLIGANEGVKAMSSTTKTRKRTRALKELEKDE